MARPTFLFLDEPASGVAPVLVDEIYDRLHQLVAEGLGLLVVDQSIERALEHSSRYYVMDDGAIALVGRVVAGGVREDQSDRARDG